MVFYDVIYSLQSQWRPLHEAARAGRAKAIEYLIKEGAQVNERTNNGQGGSPLWYVHAMFWFAVCT